MAVTLHHGDCRAVLATLPDASVQCVVTSPPYFGLRDYGTATWEGGDPGCDHRIWGHAADKPTPGGRGGSMPAQEVVQRERCRKCGARRIDAQIGIEASPDAYVAELVAMFRELRRVLRDDGTAWLNIGDSYAGSWGARGRGEDTNAARPDLEAKYGTDAPARRGYPALGIKPKDLIGIPWMVAFALRADGWYLRSDVIWHKPNPMPESVTDRPTSAHEHVFLLSKRERYFWDADAVREPVSELSLRVHGNGYDGNSVNPKSAQLGQDGNLANNGKDRDLSAGRNLRNVWTIATQPYAGAHFATMPADLAERCIKAGTKPGDTVLDPFAGAGTTGLVADRLGRNAVLIELNPEYAGMARDRITNDAPLFANITLAEAAD